MKKVLLLLLTFIPTLIYAQTYEEKLNKAGQALEKKEYCEALTFFEDAFKETTKIGAYDLAFGSTAALNCKKEKLALAWLKLSQEKGLGLNPGEADNISKDPVFEKLHQYNEWTEFVNAMKKAFKEKEIADLKKKEDWKKTILLNSVKNKSDAVKTGYALYFTKVDDQEIPFIVYVPYNYNSKNKSEAFVYLHGGIMNTENFNFEDPAITGEPIFEIGKEFNAIIIYPFGKKDFGWVNQLKAFQNIYTVIENVKSKYNIGSIYLGGMSNGGTAAFWFANQKQNQFKGFYAFSPNPKLEIGAINFKNLSQGKPFLSINAIDDNLFNYKDVFSVYTDNKDLATDWDFKTIETGNHGFIYNGKEGLNTMRDLFTKLISIK